MTSTTPANSVARKANPLPKGSLRTRLTAIIFFSLLVMTIVVISVLSYWQVRSSRTAMAQEANSIVTVLAQDFVKIIALDSIDLAADTSARLQAFRDLLRAEVFDQKNKLNFTYVAPQLQTKPNPALLQHSMKITLPLQYNGRRYGHVKFYFSMEQYEESVRDYISYLLYLLPVLMMLAFFISWSLQRYIMYPIDRLLEAVTQVHDEHDYEVRLKETGSLETATLFRHFNRMMSSIQEATQQLHTQGERLLVTFESIADGVIATNRSGDIIYTNPVSEEMTGWDEHDALGQPLETVLRLYHDKGLTPLTGHIDKCLSEGTVRFLLNDVLLSDRSGNFIAVQCSIAPIRDKQGEIEGAVVVFRNVAEARELALKLKHEASHDSLTNLINRSEFELQINKLLKITPPDTQHAVMYVDLDQFKIVNDTCGHMAGDAMLQQLSAIIHNSVRETDLVARLGGDEFGVLLPSCNQEKAMQKAEKLRQSISEYSFSWGQKLFKSGASIGVVMISDPGITYHDIMQQADIACYAAKNLGRNRIHVYVPGDRELARMHGEMQWVTRIEHAFEHDEFHLFAQKIESLQNPKVFQYEVLIRLMESDGSIHFPGSFLPAAERYGLMPRIDRLVIHKILSDESIYNFLQTHKYATIAINLSRNTLTEETFLEFVINEFENSRINPDRICFEITETAAISNVPVTVQFTEEMRKRGCTFALDDFGSGMSSFGYLKNLQFDYIKIDGSFVCDIKTDTTNYAMVQAINHIGKVMGIKTIAEFVLDRDTYDLIKKINVDMAQGYYLHRPTPIEEIFSPANPASEVKSVKSQS